MEELEDEIDREKRELAALREAQRLKERTIQDLIRKKERLKEKQEEEEECHNCYEEVAEEGDHSSNAQKSPTLPPGYEEDKRRVGEGYYYVEEEDATPTYEVVGQHDGGAKFHIETHKDGYQTFTRIGTTCKDQRSTNEMESGAGQTSGGVVCYEEVYERRAGAYDGRRVVATDEFYVVEEVGSVYLDGKGEAASHQEGSSYIDDDEREPSMSESDDGARRKKRDKKAKKNGKEKKSKREKRMRERGSLLKRDSGNKHIRKLMHGLESEGEEDIPWPIDERGIQELPISVWSKRFQAYMALEDEQTRLLKLAYLAHDFQHAAEVYGRIIISERYLPVEDKTIKPLDIGGVAGGDKYVVMGILFKFALDKELVRKKWMYGDRIPNDSLAMKAADHELRSLARILASETTAQQSVSAPLMSIVNYRGFRIIAVSVIPISKQTIIYGSHDGGKTVHADYEAFNMRLNRIFAGFNLKAHMVKDCVLQACGDIEGHWGTDNKLYLADFARLFPPEAGSVAQKYFTLKEPRAVFYKLLRPEFLVSNPVPLCSDAFTGWQSMDPEWHDHNHEVKLATERLHNVVIPEFVKYLHTLCRIDRDRFPVLYTSFCPLCQLQRWGASAQQVTHDTIESGANTELLYDQLLNILHRMHKDGINRRYLGVLRGLLVQYEHKSTCHWKYRALLYTEMAARVCKNIIQALLREKMKRLKVPSEEPYRHLLLQIFNMLASHSQDSVHFWSAIKPPPIIINHFAGGVEQRGPEDRPKEMPHDDGDHYDAFEFELEGGAEYYIYKYFRSLEKKNRGKAEAEEDSWGSPDGPETDWANILLPIKLCIKAKFGSMAFYGAEWQFSDRRHPYIFQGVFFRRLCSMLGVVLSDQPRIFDVLNGSPVTRVPIPFEFMDPYIADLKVKGKQLQIMYHSEGVGLWLAGRRMEQELAGQQAQSAINKKVAGLFLFAKRKLRSALDCIPDSVNTLLHLGRVDHWLALNWETNTDVCIATLKNAYDYYTQAINILKIRQTLTKADRNTLIEGTLEMAQLQCNLSMVSTTAATEHHSSERRKTLWRSAWQTYLDILLDYSAAVKPIFLSEIEEAMTLEKTDDVHYPGKIVSAVMKVEAMRKLETHEYKSSLIARKTAYEKQKAKKAKTKKDSEATSIFHLIGSLTVGDVLSASAIEAVPVVSSPATRKSVRAEKRPSLSSLSSTLKLTLLKPNSTKAGEDIHPEEMDGLLLYLWSYNDRTLCCNLSNDDEIYLGSTGNFALWCAKRGEDGRILLKNHHQKWLCADKNGKLRIDREQSSSWEVEKIPDKDGAERNEVALRCRDTGKYMSVSKHGLVAADKQAPKSNKERWRLTRASNLFNICSLSGDYLYFGLRGEVRSTSGVPKEFNTWMIEEEGAEAEAKSPAGGVIVSIKSMDGNYLRYDPASGLVANSPTSVQTWKKRMHANSTLGEAYTLELHEPPPTGGNRRWLSIDAEGNVLLSHTKCRWVVHRYSTTWAQKVGFLYSKLVSPYGPGISAELRLGVFVS